MASFTRTNGIGLANATKYETANVTTFVLTAGSTPTYGIGGTLEAIAQEFNPMIMEASGTKIIMVMDGHATSTADIARRASEIIASTTCAQPASIIGM